MSTAARNPLHGSSPGNSVTQLRFQAGGALNEHLRGFYKPEEPEQEGGLQGLFLYSDDSLRAERSKPRDLLYGAQSKTPAEIAELQRRIDRRGHMLRPLAKRLQLSSVEGSTRGILVRMDVILDELTAAAVRGIMVVHPDNSIATHHHIPKERLVGREAYLKACMALSERLLNEKAVPLQVTSVEVVENVVER